MEESSLILLSEVGPPMTFPPGRLAPTFPVGADPEAVSAKRRGRMQSKYVSFRYVVVVVVGGGGVDGCGGCFCCDGGSLVYFL